MSLNTAHANNGVLIHAGESILLFSDNVTLDFNSQNGQEFKGQKTGRIYLTTHRWIFNNKKPTDPMLSFSAPFVALSSVEVEQPVFGANQIKGYVQAQEHGGFQGRAGFKMVFKSGGAIDFAQAMLRAVQMARRNYQFDAPPPYMPPNGNLYPAPPPAYTPSPQGYYGWHPATQAFPNQPPPNSVYMHDSPPPYPGIGGQAPPMQQPEYGGGMAGAGGGGWMPPQQQPQQPGYPGAQGYAGGPQPGYPGGQQQPGYPGGQQQPGYPVGPQPGYPGAGQPGQYPPQQQQGGYNPGYNQPQPGGAAMGFNPGFNAAGGQGPSSSANNAKSQEAAQAYYDPSQPQTAYVPPPPAYYEQPPSYNSLNK